MSKIKAVFLDFYGTLGPHPGENDPENKIRRVFGEIMRENGRTWNYDEVERINCTTLGEDNTDYIKKILPQLKIPVTQENIALMLKMGEENKKKISLYEETSSLIRELKEKNIKIALISDCWYFGSKGIEEALKKNYIFSDFDLFLTSMTVSGHLKKDGTAFRKAIKEFEIKPEQALMVGDSIPSDMNPAEQLGIRTVLFDPIGNQDYSPKVSTLKGVLEYI